MRKRLAGVLLVGTAMAGLITGCGIPSLIGKSYKESELTDEQRAVLADWVSEDALNDDKIDVREKSILEKYDAVAAYLSEKYPDNEFTITYYGGRAGEMSTDKYTFGVVATNYPDEAFTVTCTRDGSFVDNAGGTLRQDEY